MQKITQAARWSGWLCLLALAVLVLAGCQSSNQATPAPPAQAQAPVAAAATPASAPSTPAKTQGVVRIKAGATQPLTDSEGHVWMAETGFKEGETAERPEIKIENTKDPALYQAEHYSMTSFSYPVPNGKYLVKLHFAETFEGITGPGQRVFSFNAQGRDFKDFDVWVKAGGPLRAYIESVPVEVKDGKVLVTFTPNVENPQICAIEIVPQP
jgi:hypothetical protein